MTFYMKHAPRTRAGRLLWAWCRGVFDRLQVARIRRYLRAEARAGRRRVFLAGPFPSSKDGRIDLGGGDLSIELPSAGASWQLFHEVATAAHEAGGTLGV